MLSVLQDKYFMDLAIKEAEKALEMGEIPVGAVISSKGQILARCHNQTEQLQDVTAHAEILAITAASNALGSKYLNDCTLYVSLEPCTMCAGALFWSQIGRIVIAARDEKRGFSKFDQSIIHPKTKIEFGLEEARSQTLLKKFFKSIR